MPRGIPKSGKRAFPEREDLTGRESENFIILKFAYRSNNKRYWVCECKHCGRFPIAHTEVVLGGYTKSCGCLKSPYSTAMGRKMSEKEKRLLSVFLTMHSRCEDNKSISYENYGARGISVSGIWSKNPEGWLNFFDWAYYNGYFDRDGLSIDRIDVNGNYESSNCRLSNKKFQANNTRSNTYVEINGMTLTARQAWEKSESPVSYKTFVGRYSEDGWSLEDALSLKKYPNRNIVKRSRRDRVKVIDPFTGNEAYVADLINKYGCADIKYGTVIDRIRRGWSVEDALATPNQQKGENGMKTNWKGAENQLANVLKDFGIPAYRKTRAGNWSISDTDVGVEGHDNLKLDSKYTKAQPFRHHGLLEVICEKYCKNPEDVGILFTKNYKEHFGNVTIHVKFFAMLLSYWLGCGTKDELWAKFMSKPTRKSNKKTENDDE